MTIKKILGLGIVTLAVLLSCSVVEVGEEEVVYYPLANGNTWTYEAAKSGSTEKDIIVCEMFEREPGIFSCKTTKLSEENQNSILMMDAVDGTEPFDDSAVAVVDSALNVPRRGWNIPTTASQAAKLDKYVIETPSGIFMDCILVKGKPDEQGVRFDGWFAPNVGPVMVEELSGGKLTRKFTLINYTPAASEQ